MSRKEQDTTIGEHCYRVRMLGGSDASAAMVKIAKAASVGLKGASLATDAGEGAMVLSGIADIVTNLPEADVQALAKQFAACTRVGGGAYGTTEPLVQLAKVYDEHFAGNMSEWLAWIAFCVEVNFADFLGLLKGKLAEVFARRKGPAGATQPSSPQASTDTSGDS